MYKRKSIVFSFLIIPVIIATIYFFSISFPNIKNTFFNIGVYLNKFFLPKSIFNIEIINGVNDEIVRENEELKSFLNINNDSFHFVSCSVIRRNNNWYDELVIDKGKDYDISLNMAVVDSNGLIGVISEVGDNYSIVKLLSNSSNSLKIAVNIVGDIEYHGIIDSYNSSNGHLIISTIIKDSNINIGDYVYTNGFGNIYPSGIYVGKVDNIYYDELNLSKIVEVKRNNNFENIRYVNVIWR